MTDTRALSRQLHQVHQEIYTEVAVLREQSVDDERTALTNLAHAISLAASLADVVTMMRMQQHCGCGDLAGARDLLGAPICASCQALVAQALEQAFAPIDQGAINEATR